MEELTPEATAVDAEVKPVPQEQQQADQGQQTTQPSQSQHQGEPTHSTTRPLSTTSKKFPSSQDIEIRIGSTRKTSFKSLAQSLPVTIPARLRAKNAFSWEDYPDVDTISDGDDDNNDDNSNFKKVPPHELAARTYHEVYLKTGLQFDLPISKNKAVKSIII